MSSVDFFFTHTMIFELLAKGFDTDQTASKSAVCCFVCFIIIIIIIIIFGSKSITADATTGDFIREVNSVD